MRRVSQDTTAREVLAAYDATVALGSSEELAAETERLQRAFQGRTGGFKPEDPWFEARSRAFWDDALATSFARLAAPRLAEGARPYAARFARAHRGLFAVEEAGEGARADARLVDVWSGAELLVHYLDEAQAVDLDHTEGLVDARVVGAGAGAALYVLPGALHHPADATEPARRVVAAARARGMSTTEALDALLRMELVLQSSSRVKASFAYRVESLPHA